jgi:hypothetical protein
MRIGWAVFIAGSICLSGFEAPLSAQGMASATRAPRPQRTIQTDLPPITVDFRDLAAQAGLTAKLVSGNESAKRYIIETTGTGVVLFDYDNDGLVDIFLVNASILEDAPGPKPISHLYRNLGGLKFEDVTEKAGLARSGWGQGACAADYDNDGRKDLFVTYYGHSVLYHNEGGGKFRDVTESSGLGSAEVRWDTGCSFFDYDLDGKLDLVVSGYVDFDRDKVPEPGAGGYCQWRGLPVICGPRGLPAGRNHLYRNEGNGKFRDVSAESGIGKPTGCYGFTVLASDFDNDGLPDLYVACDSTPSLLYRNLGGGKFEEMGVASGCGLNEDGQEQAGMGVAVADYDDDGFVDLVKTNFSDDTPNLYHNNGDGTFNDEVYQSGLGTHTQYLGWGTNFLDVDNDGRREILIVTGHVYPEVDRAALGIRFRQPRLLYWNVGKRRFKDISTEAGPAIAELHSSRGSATADLDNDGSLEIVINNMGEPPSLLKNFGPRKNWLLVQLTGVTCNRDAIGARVFVYSGGRQQAGEIQTGTSFLSQNDSRQHFGLGDATGYDRIEVLWPGGMREAFPGGRANQIVSLKQGTGKAVTSAPPATRATTARVPKA